MTLRNCDLFCVSKLCCPLLKKGDAMMCAHSHRVAGAVLEQSIYHCHRWHSSKLNLVNSGFGIWLLPAWSKDHLLELFESFSVRNVLWLWALGIGERPSVLSALPLKHLIQFLGLVKPYPRVLFKKKKKVLKSVFCSWREAAWAADSEAGSEMEPRGAGHCSSSPSCPWPSKWRKPNKTTQLQGFLTA